MRKRRLLYIVCLLGVFWLNVIYVEYQFFLLLVLLIVVPAISGVLFELAANGLKLYLNHSTEGSASRTAGDSVH